MEWLGRVESDHLKTVSETVAPAVMRLPNEWCPEEYPASFRTVSWICTRVVPRRPRAAGHARTFLVHRPLRDARVTSRDGRDGVN